MRFRVGRPGHLYSEELDVELRRTPHVRDADVHVIQSSRRQRGFESKRSAGRSDPDCARDELAPIDIDFHHDLPLPNKGD